MDLAWLTQPSLARDLLSVYVALLPEYFHRAVNPADAAAGATDGTDGTTAG